MVPPKVAVATLSLPMVRVALVALPFCTMPEPPTREPVA